MNHQTFVSTLSFLPKMSGLRESFGRLVLIMILFLTLPLLAFYIFQVGIIIKGNYLVKIYNENLKSLSLENEILGIEAIQDLSLENVEKEIQKLNFVPVSEIRYIPVSYDYLVKENQ
ncbi:hypothetical protein KJA17_02730 [Patescibacteria group bacterium]|nr:hypothetical protein [Patescibacteria group bacterium]